MGTGSLEAAVIGAGTAGSATALFLARAGHRVSLFEAVPEPSAVGAGLMLQPTGMAVLARLGLLDELISRGAPVGRLLCVAASKRGARPRTVLDLHYQHLSPAAFGLGMHRGALFDVLFRAMQAEPSISIHCGLRIDALDSAAGKTELVDQGGHRHGPFDLVVVGDGARSRLRRAHPSLRREREYRWGALWAILEDPGRDFDGELYQVVASTKEMIGFLPSGLGPTGDTPLVSMFWSIRQDQVGSFREAGLDRFRARALELVPRAEPVLAQVQSLDALLFARYHDVVMSRWHTEEGVVFVGDAAHAMSPQLGQGANIALVDAAVLADAIGGSSSVQTALEAYSDQRRRPLAYYQWATRFLTPFFQSDWSMLGLLRDMFMGSMCRIQASRNKMLRTMCGIERGLIRPALPVPELGSRPSLR